MDYVVSRAEELGLYVGMLPTWGDKVSRKWDVGPEIFTPENARVYEEFLGERCGGLIAWVLGGDRAVEDERQLAVWRAMGEGFGYTLKHG